MFCKAIEGKVLLLDCQTRDKNAVATKFGYIEERFVVSMPDAFFAVGGITVLLPLFSPQLRPKNVNSIELNIQLITLLIQMVKENPDYQEEMYRTMFFPIMGHLLAGCKTDMWSKEAVVTFAALSQVITDKTLFAQLYVHVFLNFEIWHVTTFEVQQQLLKTIQTCAQEEFEKFRTFATVDFFMDLLDKYYCFEKEEGSTTKAQRRELRFILLSIVRTLVQLGINGDETRAIVLYIQRESRKPASEQQCIDVLQLLVTLLSQKIPGIFQCVEDMGYFNVFLSLLQKENEPLFIWALKILGTLLIGQNPNAPPDKERIKSFHSVKKYLEHVPFTTNIYFALLEIALGCIALKGLENLVVKHKAAAIGPHPEQNEPPPTFRVPGILKIIFSMMVLGGNKDLNLIILQDMEYLISISEKNRRFFLSQRLWQSWLLSLIAKENPSNYHTTTDNTVFLAVVRMFATLHLHALSMRGGYKIFRQSSGMIHHFHGMGFMDQNKFLRLVHQHFSQISQFQSPEGQARILQKASPEGQARILQKAGTDPMIWRSIADWLFSIEEFLFYHDPKLTLSEYSFEALQVHRNTVGLWADIVFGHKLLDFLSQFVTFPIMPSLDPEVTSYISEEYPQAFDRLKRFHFRLMLTTLLEATKFQNYYQNAAHSNSFETINKLISENFQLSNRNIQRSLATYLEGKTKQWDVEGSDITLAVRKSVTSISVHLDSLNKNPVSNIYQTHLILICANLQAALRNTVIQNTQLVQALQNLLIKAAKGIKLQLMNHPEQGPVLSLIPDAQLHFWFSEGLAKPASWPFTPYAFPKIHQWIDSEFAFRTKINEILSSDSDSYRRTVEEEMMEELEYHQLAHSTFTRTWNNLVQQVFHPLRKMK